VREAPRQVPTRIRLTGATRQLVGLAMDGNSCSDLRFEEFRLIRDRRELWHGDRRVKLGGRAFDTLVTLISRRGEPVSKRELMEAVWPKLFVEENNLQVQVATLRKILGERAIVTIPGRGYQFSLEVSQEASDGAAPERPVMPVGPTNLPSALPQVYGRSEDLRELAGLLRRHSFVSVVGPGGIGKTRLVETIAFGFRSEFPDGVWKVDLAALADARLVCEAVSRVLGNLSLGERDSADGVARSLERHRALLVIDNCEHLLEAVATLAAAIRNIAPTVVLLVTSQEPLKQEGETLFRLGPLAVPDAISPADVLDIGAVQLFLARVQAIEPRFSLDDDTAIDVLEICRRLDGIPLALELAAARVPVIGTRGVRERLDERFRLLTGGTRLALRRHQTLVAAFEWSYGLLSEAEKELFELLGVFVGSFSLVAAQRVASEHPGLGEWESLEILAMLVDKSLVLVLEGKQPRYRMLETTRAYALHRLADRGGMQLALRRHAEVFLGLFESLRIAADSASPDVAAICAQLEHDLENLRAALTWASGVDGDHRIGIALVGAVAAGPYWSQMGLYSEPLKWGRVFNDRIDESIVPEVAARFYLSCGQPSSIGPAEFAIASARRAAELFASIGDRQGEYTARCYEAARHTTAGQLAEARVALDQAAALLEPSWETRRRGELDRATWLYYIYADQPEEAKSRLQIFIRKSCGSGRYEAEALLADVEMMLGNVAAAVEICRNAMAKAAKSGVQPNALVLRVLGVALLEQGHLDDAEEAFRSAIPLLKRRFGTAAPVLDDAKLLLVRRGRLEDAARVGAFAETDYLVAGRQRRPVSARNDAVFLQALRAATTDERLEVLKQEGRRLSEAAACEIAFGASARV
jgi:predicted ATPase/DNA-binding winged helix-turn-helix (wHTH) protein